MPKNPHEMKTEKKNETDLLATTYFFTQSSAATNSHVHILTNKTLKHTLLELDNCTNT